MDILTYGNLPMKILPGRKQIMLQVFLPMVFFKRHHKYLDLCHHGWMDLIKPYLTSKARKEDLNRTCFLDTNCHALLKLFWKTNGLWALTALSCGMSCGWRTVGFRRLPSVCTVRGCVGLWNSRAKAPGQNAWAARGKCFELEPTAFCLLFYVTVYTLPLLGFYHRMITLCLWFHSQWVEMWRLVSGSFALRYFWFSALILAS